MSPPRFILVVVLLLAASPLLAADPPPAKTATPADETIVLPPFAVPGDFPAEGWVYAHVDHTEFISQLSLKKTRDFMDDFMIFQEFVRANYPEAALPADYPVTIVLCDSTTTFRTFGGSPGLSTSILPHSERYILIDANQLATSQIFQAIRRPWMELAFRHQTLGRDQFWRELGTKEILSSLLIRDGHLELGFTPSKPVSPGGKEVRPGPLPPMRAEQFEYVMPGDMLPLEKLFRLTRQSPDYDGYNNPMQAAAFMHMCQFSVRHKYLREPYRKFITRLEKEPFSEKLFQECFGKSTKDMKFILNDYMFGASRKYESLSYKFPPTPPFDVRPAKPGEVLRLLRDCQQLLAAADPAKSR